MTLIDTSSWIHAFRRIGHEQIRARVRHLVENGQAAWCAIVRLELWAGVGGEEERKTLRDFENHIPDLSLTDEIWEEACELASRCRKAGKSAPASDILIAACARHHRVKVETADAHFDFLMKL
jgi:hypothetical protein